MASYEQEQQERIEQRDILQADISKAEKVHDNVQTFLNLIQKYTDIQELTAAILHELIDKIVVHEKEETEDGKKVQMVEIHYRFIGYIPMWQMFDGVGSINGYPVGELIAEALCEAKQRYLTTVAV